ncbi:transcriptional regulator [Brachybacterium ginsengisoli]|uniref:Transcriptional regulator n=1 Tax=Brachybacterium ginsengisoli TaxID=1331682 RepID=A0A291H0J4_9MICO|nr:sugar-binding domain-containing protein [Brachybacterium ginsengisoli]ATG55981.1 transcriptional regulator [Brachybacterium ginsengisoli]
MPAARDISLIVSVARLYYDRGFSQSQVASELNLSRSNVSRILSQAKERGIVEIIIHDPSGPPQRVATLEQGLRAEYGLRDVHVVSATPSSAAEVTARQGAAVLSDRLPGVSRVGVSWGQAVQSVIDHLDQQELHPVPELLPLVGGLSALDQLASGESVLRALASKLGSRPLTLYAPAVLESAETVRSLRTESSIASVLEAAATVELALVGIGSAGVHSSVHIMERMKLSAAEQRLVEEQRPVGDICARMVDADGRPVGPPADERVLAVTFDELRAIPEVIGVVFGVEKAPGVSGVLRSGVLDTVVLDEHLARRLLPSS